jgi:hypothetical protein
MISVRVIPWFDIVTLLLRDLKVERKSAEAPDEVSE